MARGGILSQCKVHLDGTVIDGMWKEPDFNRMLRPVMLEKSSPEAPGCITINPIVAAHARIWNVGSGV
jgi:hypothetical protein